MVVRRSAIALALALAAVSAREPVVAQGYGSSVPTVAPSPAFPSSAEELARALSNDFTTHEILGPRHPIHFTQVVKFTNCEFSVFTTTDDLRGHSQSLIGGDLRDVDPAVSAVTVTIGFTTPWWFLEIREKDNAPIFSVAHEQSFTPPPYPASAPTPNPKATASLWLRLPSDPTRLLEPLRGLIRSCSR